MGQTVFHDNKGMTLIEVLISFVLLTIISLALLQSALLAVNINVRNELRDVAVSVAEQRMTELRNTAFASLTDGTVKETDITRYIRSGQYNFTPTTEIKTLSATPSSKQVIVTISWKYKNQPYSHSVSTVLRGQ